MCIPEIKKLERLIFHESWQNPSPQGFWLVIARVVLSVVSLSRNYVIPETFCYSLGQVEISISWQLVRDVQSKPAHSKVLSNCLNTKLIDMLIHRLVQLLSPNLNYCLFGLHQLQLRLWPHLPLLSVLSKALINSMQVHFLTLSLHPTSLCPFSFFHFSWLVGRFCKRELRWSHNISTISTFASFL